MKKYGKKGFTLIELIAVLVIMAIIALIATPLVMSIIRKARVSADKRSIDAYGRSIELAIAGYLLDTGNFPTEVSQLTIEYSGNEVVCETTQINTDSSVYLAGCTVGGRSVEGYTYGKGGEEESTTTYTAYQVGDEVTYNNVNYYVIKDSTESEQSVTLLKAEPLTVEEITTYSAGTGAQTDGNGGMAYYNSSTCGFVNNDYVVSGCTTDYVQSEVKYVVDAWKNANAPVATEARLITFDELTEDLGFELQQVDPTQQMYEYTESTPSWVYNSSYSYWTMSRCNDSSAGVWGVSSSRSLETLSVFLLYGKVRPVIVLPKSAL